MKRLKKLWQRCILDTLIMRPPPLPLLFVILFVIIFAVGFWCAHWIDHVDLSGYKPYDVLSDNIGGEPVFNKMTALLPVDVVYTWVNGSDPYVLDGLLKLTKTEKFSCGYTNCFPSKYYVIQNTSNITNNLDKLKGLRIFKTVELSEKNVSRMFHIVQSEENIEFVKNLIASHLGNGSFVQQAYWTTERKIGWSIQAKNAFVVMLESEKEIHEEMSDISPENYERFNEHCATTRHKDLYIIDCPDIAFVETLKKDIEAYKKKHNGSFPKKDNVTLVLHFDLPESKLDINRFEDNEELRYSLRSLEKYAPWVRKIFLVTNGQIPYWLNLDHPKLSIITHEQIFADFSHLPTFSSPAIEANIQRIPGLSEHFLYLNDDVMFGDFVWLEDFFSPTSGYKVYLAWSLPECSSGCPGTWISDGYCDHSCNTSACNWDGGDCLGAKDQTLSDFGDEIEDTFLTDSEFCSSTCSDSWLADLYCDAACSTSVCGYDAGDCGSDAIKENLFQLNSEIKDNKTLSLPKGVVAGWIDLSSVLKQYQNVTIKGDFIKNKSVRIAAVNVPYAMIIVVLKGNCSGIVQIELYLTKENDLDNHKKIYFNIHYDTFPIYENTDIKDVQFSNTSKYNVKNFDFALLSPKVFDTALNVKNMTLMSFNVSKSSLPSKLVNEIKELEEEFIKERITKKGFQLKKAFAIEKYLEENSKMNLKKNFVRKLLFFENETLNYYYPIKEQKLQYSAHLNQGTLDTFQGNFPWERRLDKTPELETETRFASTSQNSNGRRKLLDIYAESLLYVNQLYNSEYGFEARRVPAHMPHFISKKILLEMQHKFSQEVYVTSSHKLRQRNDFQFAFSYFYYLMSEKKAKTHEEIFDKFDTDYSGTWSDREIRTFLATTNDLPLHYNSILELHTDLRNCSDLIKTMPVPTQPYERYADSDLPTISKELIVKCSKSILAPRMEGLRNGPRFTYLSASDSAIHFKMITSNISTVVYHLDEVRKNPRKFICLNSNLDPKSNDNDLIRALVQDTYESLYPFPSSFELPLNYRNRFLYTWELNKWKRWRNATRAFIYAAMCCLIVLTLITFFSKEIETMKKKWCRRSKRKDKLLLLARV